MSGTNLAEAKAKLSALVDRAMSGEPQVLLRRGKPVAKIVAIDEPRQPIDLNWLQSVTKGMEMSEEVVTRMRDGYRY